MVNAAKEAGRPAVLFKVLDPNGASRFASAFSSAYVSVSHPATTAGQAGDS